MKDSPEAALIVYIPCCCICLTGWLQALL